MKKLSVHIMLLLMLISVSCEHDIELDLKQSKKIVLLGVINPHSPLEIVLGTSSISSSDPVIYPEEAQVLVFEDGKEIGKMEFVPASEFSLPNYKLNYEFLQEKEYSIEATEDNFETIYSRTTIPSKPPRIRSELIYLEPVGQEQGYIYFFGKLQLEIIGEMEDDEFYHINMSRDVITRKGSMEDGYERNTNRENLFFTFNNSVPAKVMTHESGILISGKSIKQNLDALTFDFELIFNTADQDRGKIYLEFRKASEEYYNFHQSVTDQDAKNLRNGLFSPRPSNIFNNIENGLGNFGAYNERENGIEW